MEKQKEYEAPRLEVVEFQLEDSIAMSADMGPSLSCSETSGGYE